MKKSITQRRQEYLLKLRKETNSKPSVFCDFFKWALLFLALWAGTILVLFCIYGA